MIIVLLEGEGRKRVKWEDLRLEEGFEGE